MELSSHLPLLSPLPFVDLNDIRRPQDGLFMAVSESCKRFFDQDDKCRHWYGQLGSDLSQGVQQCPHGFATYVLRNGPSPLALTGFIPYPRLGGSQERALAKQNPKSKCALETVERFASQLAIMEARLDRIETEVIDRHSMALHEIRKLNRSIKQSAERLCNEASPNHPDRADSRLVTIWKTAELMSHQFDVIELLANESLTKLPLNSEINVYRIFDKCARILEQQVGAKRIRLSNLLRQEPLIAACDKTFPIIPTVLLQNAVKYGESRSPIRVDLEEHRGWLAVKVANRVQAGMMIGAEVFQKGVRGSTDADGSGHGLYLAQLVVKQHRGDIQVRLENGLATFTTTLPLVSDASSDSS